MNEQYEKSLTKLELDKVLALLADQASSQAAKEPLPCRPSEHGRGRDPRTFWKRRAAACACITVKGSPGFGGSV